MIQFDQPMVLVRDVTGKIWEIRVTEAGVPYGVIVPGNRQVNPIYLEDADDQGRIYRLDISPSGVLSTTEIV